MIDRKRLATFMMEACDVRLGAVPRPFKLFNQRTLHEPWHTICKPFPASPVVAAFDCEDTGGQVYELTGVHAERGAEEGGG